MTRFTDRAAARALDRAVAQSIEASAERMRASGRLDRRAFLRVMGLGLAAPLAMACNAVPGADTSKLLRAVGAQNEKLERWLLRQANRTDRVPRGVPVAGDAFPSYFISDRVPVWNSTMRGPWRLEVDGAVRRPLQLTAEEVGRLATRTQRVHHYCVEGWSAVAEFQGVPLAALARLVEPTRDAAYVDFSSFDKGYHESWDLESAMHPQTLVVVAKDGVPLSPAYGAPARVHSPIKLGYKNTKYLTRITFLPQHNGGYWSNQGYEWFGGT